MEFTAQPTNKISKIYYCHKGAYFWPTLIFFGFLFDYVLAFGCVLLLQPHGIVTATPLVFMPAFLNFEILLLPLYVCQLNVMLVKIFAKKTCFNHFFNGTASIHISNHNYLSIPLQSSVNHVF